MSLVALHCSSYGVGGAEQSKWLPEPGLAIPNIIIVHISSHPRHQTETCFCVQTSHTPSVQSWVECLHAEVRQCSEMRVNPY